MQIEVAEPNGTATFRSFDAFGLLSVFRMLVVCESQQNVLLRAYMLASCVYDVCESAVVVLRVHACAMFLYSIAPQRYPLLCGAPGLCLPHVMCA